MARPDSLLAADTAVLEGTKRTRDGYLVAQVRAARAGNVQVYRGAELGVTDMSEVRIYRPADAVFAGESMATWPRKPLTNDHPPEEVTADNWRSYAVGWIDGEVARDGEFLRLPIMCTDGATIRDIEDGKQELSCGYRMGLDWTAGTTPSGEQYDAKVTGIVGNHLAIVAAGRAGPECRIGDSAWGRAAPVTPPPAPSLPHSNGDRPMPGELRTVALDGHLTIETTVQGAQAIERLQAQARDAAAAHATALDAARHEAESLRGQVAALTGDAARTRETHQGELAALRAAHQQALDAAQGELAAVRNQIPDTAALDALIEARISVANDAALLLGEFDPRGLDAATIRSRAVAHRMGAAAVADRSADYIAACFDTLVAQAKNAPAALRPDPLAARIAAGSGTVAVTGAVPGNDALTAQASAREAYHARLRNGWNSNAQEAR